MIDRLVPHDKALHALVGLILYSFIALYSPILALGVVVFVDLGKELFEECNYGGFALLGLWFIIILPLVRYCLEKLI